MIHHRAESADADPSTDRLTNLYELVFESNGDATWKRVEYISQPAVNGINRMKNGTENDIQNGTATSSEKDKRSKQTFGIKVLRIFQRMADHLVGLMLDTVAMGTDRLNAKVSEAAKRRKRRLADKEEI